MKDKIYLDDYILTYEKACKYLINLTDKNYHNNRRFLVNTLGTTNFSFPINSYEIGSGKNHVVIVGTTHGCELLTTYFVIETMIELLMNEEVFEYFTKEYTLHFIPILNPEGFIISSSNVYKNIYRLNWSKLQNLSTIYLNKYNIDDENAKNGIIKEKCYKKVLKSSLENIIYQDLRYSVKQILKDCNLTECVLPIWSANGVGIDPNANSIHKFNEISELRRKQKYHKLRYNDIPTYKPSPIGFPGFDPLTLKCPETYYFNEFIQKLYSKNIKSKKERLIAIFSYHTTGGEIYSFPDKEITLQNNLNIHNEAIHEYEKYTNYVPKDESIKYGFMDYYRSTLENVVSMTIELSRKNANPIGPFSNLCEILEEIKQNKKALFNTINFINKIV